MTGVLEADKKRMLVMLAVTGVCVVVALAALVVEFRFGADWAMPAFIVALVSGFAAQVWFIAGFARGGKS